MFEKLKNFINDLNTRGVPLPTLRDPKTGLGSISLTMMVISHMAALALLLGKVTKLVGDVDYSNVLWLLGLTSSLYFGRQYQQNGKNMSLGAPVAPSTNSLVKPDSSGESDAGSSK